MAVFIARQGVVPKSADPVLNNNDWQTISEISASGEAANYWSVGDCKEVTLNGTVGILSLSNFKTYAFIIGIDHNSAIEGNNLIHFQLAKTALSGGTDICFVDSKYLGSGRSGFCMNPGQFGDDNSGGWKDSRMRKETCGTSKISTSGAISGAVTGELLNVIKSVKKYTNNMGGYNSGEAAVTETNDYFFLLSECELMGNTKYANSYEADYQRQYAYYSSGNSKRKYRHDETGSAAYWWLRSPQVNSSYDFVYFSSSATSHMSSLTSLGFSPCFCV